MNGYIDLVLCRNEDNGFVRLYQAPAWSGVKEGDKVIVEGYDKTELLAVVLGVYTTKSDRADYDFIVKMAGTALPLRKVISRMWYEELNYDEVKGAEVSE